MSPLEPHELISPLDRALVIVSHPDDGEFGAAASIAHLTRAGVRVDYVVTTDGGKGTEDPEVTPEQLSATRVAEQRAAADILGVRDIVHLGTGEATLASVYPAARDHLNFPELWRDEGLEPWKVRQVLLTGVEEPNLWVDVEGTFEVGLRAILAHASQVDPDTVGERMRERARTI